MKIASVKIISLAVFCGWAFAAAGLAQDIIFTKNAQYRGKVLSADARKVVIQTEQGVLNVPRAAIEKLTVALPADIAHGIEVYEKNNFRTAKLELARAVTQYSGLDTPWAAKAIVYYGRSCLAAGDIVNAEKAFTVFLGAYAKDHPLAMDAGLGLAEIEVARKNIDKALPKFQELTAEYDNQVRPPKEQFPYASAAFLGLGKCLEAKDDVDGALTAYLKVIALYPADNVLPEALYLAALIYQKQNKPANANLLLKDLIAQYPASPFAGKAAQLSKQIESLLEKETEAAKAEK